MTAAEITNHPPPDPIDQIAMTLLGIVGPIDESIEVLVDEEWCITGGESEMAALLGLDPESISGIPIGRFMHPDDVGISPARIWRSGHPRVIKFRERDGYVRLAVRIRRSANGWLLELTGVEAEVLQFPRNLGG